MSTVILKESETYNEDLEKVLREVLLPIGFYFDTLLEVDENIGVVGKALYDRAMLQSREIANLLNRQIGRIEFTGACYQNSQDLLPGTLISCRFKGSGSLG